MEIVDVGTMQAARHALTLHPSRQVARHAVVRRSIDAVRREVYFDNVFVFDIIIFASGSAGHSRFGEHDDAVVRRADADFVFCANHTERFHAADFRLLDGKFVVAVVKLCADGSHNDVLSGSHVRRSADNLRRLAVAKVDGGDV